MPSSPCRRRPRFKSPTPHFFKEVPKKFVLRHGEALQTGEVRLKVASGAEWNVGLSKSNGNVWLENGWQEFAEFYSIGFNYFLVFRYEGNSCFHVVIFDPSATEIEYPMAFGEFDGEIRGFQVPKMSENNNGEFEDDGSVQILGNKRRREDKTQSLYSVVDKRMRRCNDQACMKKMAICSSCELKRVKVLRNNQDLQCPESKATRKEQVSRADTSKSKHDQDLPSVKIESQDLKPDKAIKSENWWRKQPSSNATEQARVTEKALTFKSMTANPSFMVTMARSYIHTGKGYLSIPKRFAEIHVKVSKEIILQVSDGRIWKIWCGARLTYSMKKVEFRGGWKAFARDNNLEEGDICVFELIESTKLSFKVTIFRWSSLENEMKSSPCEF